MADFSGMDPLIYREPLRTEQYDATNLNGKKWTFSFTLIRVSLPTAFRLIDVITLMRDACWSAMAQRGKHAILNGGFGCQAKKHRNVSSS